MRNVIHVAAVVAAVLSSAWPAGAQDPIQQTVVVTAAASPVTLASATRTLTLITRDQIEALPAGSVADVLRLVSSVDVRGRGARGIQSDFSVRGAGFGQMLVLVDGVRLNDAQSGHHNGDIPVPLDAIERIEVLHGVGSSLFGGDAFGGTINIITRQGSIPASASLSAGSFNSVAGQVQAGYTKGVVRQHLAISADRSSGFMFARDYDRVSARTAVAIGGRTRLSAAYLRNDFGANGFYGASPSHEWTNQALFTADRRLGTLAGWRVDAATAYRTHGDRFLWDVRRPGVSENDHRTHAWLGTVKALRSVGPGASVVVGGEGGMDVIRSNNLGDHSIRRISTFGEWRQAIGTRTQLDASLRMDRYSEFGTAWSPGFGAGWWATPALKLRASAGRAFRVPTFTERYYSDPAHQARAALTPETAWSGDAGADLSLASTWSVGATLFHRREQDVIDWLRPTSADRWQTFNVRDVHTTGVELSVRRVLPGGAFVQAAYTGLDLNAAAVSQLSKYVLDTTPHAVTAAAVLHAPGQMVLAPRFEFKRRSFGVSARTAAVLDLRASRRVSRWQVSLDLTNLLGDRYQEVFGVDMPGRAAMVTLGVGGR